MPGLIESEENSNAPTLTNSGGRPSSDDDEDTGTPTFSEQTEHWPHSAGHTNAVDDFYNDLENGPDPDQEIRNAFQSFRSLLRSVDGLSDVDRNTLQMSLDGLENTVEGQCARSVNRTMMRQAGSAQADGSSSAREELRENADRGWLAQFR